MLDVLVRVLNGLLMLLLPLIVALWLARRLGARWRVFAVGMLTFVASQMLHIPFNAVVLVPWMQRLGWVGVHQGWPLLVGSLLLGLSAGLFEETARWVAIRFGLRRDRTWPDGVTFGAGHGGIEAVLLGLLVWVTLAQMLAYRSTDLTGLVPPDQISLAQAQIAGYWALPWQAALLGAVERAATLPLHIALSVLILLAIVRRQAGWWLAAVAWHTAANAVALVSLAYLGMYATEGLLLLNAGSAVYLTLRLRWLLPAVDPAPPPRSPAEGNDLPATPSLPQGPSVEGIESSRYHSSG